MDSLNQVIFDDKTFSDLIAELRPLIQNLGDATVVVPLIKEYMEISVKNDDHLLKMAAIVQRLSTGNATSGGGDMLTEEEMNQLQNIIEETEKEENVNNHKK